MRPFILRVNYYAKGYPEIEGTAGWAYRVEKEHDGELVPVSPEVMGHGTEAEALLAAQNWVYSVLLGVAIDGANGVPGALSRTSNLSYRDLSNHALMGAALHTKYAQRLSAKRRSWTFVDKSTWPRGVWDDEPDKEQWEDEATRLPCLIVRGPDGALCGYVGVEKGRHVEVDHLRVHGGVNIVLGAQAAENEYICHAPDPAWPEWLTWIGFDCGHIEDYAPGEKDVEDFGRVGPGKYRDIAYVREQVTELAKQIRALK